LEFYHCESDISGSGIYTENNGHRNTLCKKTTFPKKLLDVVEYYLQKTFFLKVTSDFFSEEADIFESNLACVTFFSKSTCFYDIREVFPEFSMTESIVERLLLC
jgi:hypothetical protein